MLARFLTQGLSKGYSPEHVEGFKFPFFQRGKPLRFGGEGDFVLAPNQSEGKGILGQGVGFGMK